MISIGAFCGLSSAMAGCRTRTSQEVGLSPSPCLRRVRILEEAGVIDRYVAILDPTKLGLGLTVFARVWLKAQDEETIAHFVKEVRKLPQVVELRGVF
jgi:DNA-binding Lrp family transcriptional regulator